MIQVIRVKVKNRNDIRHFRTDDHNLTLDDNVIFATDSGEEIGIVLASASRELSLIHKVRDFPSILRKATNVDVDNFNKRSLDEVLAYDFCFRRIKDREFPIKLDRVKFLSTERKAIFYYSSEGRVDFRDLVRDLSRKFRMRIEMRQIGVRDEAKMIGGLGVCGRELCCKTFLKGIVPIGLQLAKTQGLNMNLSRLTGQCGRLKCCIAFEDGCAGNGNSCDTRDVDHYVDDHDDLVGFIEEDGIEFDS
ncbi:MAG: hypothetical protein GY940_36540 [bacterium]|nr:hypothetical protein [bacterium]